ncbi:C-factor isoform X2 [Cheilinus undulatus]|uniref:C-factor isoform X2 n=1 Tax=Cheilinus undulatus TaxID=241271 RepID=UPI001BD230B8|nr:C-factor isoform X2 [Cheilinus undulatus]
MTELTDAQSQRGEQAHRRSVNMFETLQGNILVTGANRGIGLELVAQLAQQVGKDAHLFACCREPEGSRAQALRDLSAQHPGKITTICLDLSDEESISAAVQAVSDQIGDGGLNLLINNAAINTPAKPAPLSTTEKQHMMEVYETNVVGPFLLAKKFLPLLQRAAESYTPEHDTGGKMSCRRSAIINMSTLISSIQKCPENFSYAQMYPYRTSKAPLTTQDSVVSMLGLMSSLSDEDCGQLLDYQGSAIPW